MAPCSHTWHYKCVRRIINGPLWPQFTCPNCRAVTDLEADVDDPFPDAEWEEVEVEDAIEDHTFEAPGPDRSRTPLPATPAPQLPSNQDTTMRSLRLQSRDSQGEVAANAVNGVVLDLEQAMDSIDISDHSASETPFPDGSNGLDAPINDCLSRPSSRNKITSQNTGSFEFDFVRADRTPSPSGRLPLGISPGNDGPMTPRNDAGPFVLDGVPAEHLMLEYPE